MGPVLEMAVSSGGEVARKESHGAKKTSCDLK
jgi:hypothetical protein